MRNYTVYHLHTDLSSCVTSIDSVTKPDDYIYAAKECGMTAMAYSEHGSVFSWAKKKDHVEAAGLKYIHAEEFYLTKTLDQKIRDNKHIVLIARNYDGVRELNKLSSGSFNRQDGHFFYVPRISLSELINTSDNIIVTSACLGGPLVRGDDDLRKAVLQFLIKNKHRCFLEVQHHAVDDQRKYNEYLLKISKKYGIPLIAGTDTHALNAQHMEARAILQKAKNISFPDEAEWDLSFKTYNQLVEAYLRQEALPLDVALEAIDNTNLMADMIETFTLDRSYKYPHLWENPKKIFLQKIKEGIKKKGVDKYPNREEYKERIKHEMEAYEHNQAIDFMLLMEDIISWCRTQDIQVGYGRGSVNGSVIAWLLGITEMDSIKYNLNFDRFMNVERVSLSDIDTDFPPSRIDDVKQYIFNKHGLYCCDIATFNTIADKGAIRDVGRALQIPLDTVSEICDSVDNEDEYRAFRERYPELFKYVDMVKGVVVSVGNHPCGTVVSPYSVDDRLGTFSTSTDPYPICQLEMKPIDAMNYVKLDLLKLDTIELIANTCKLAGIPMVTPDTLDINDDAVWNSMREDTTQIFQWEGAVGNQYIKELLSDDNLEKFRAVNKNVDRMTLLSIGNSAIRPAGAGYRNDLARGVIRTTGSQAIDDFLKPTFGYLVFQCQIIEFLHSYCGFTMGEADIVRRHFSKKLGTDKDIPIIKDGGYMTEDKKHYIPGFIATMKEKYGMEEKEAEQTIVEFLDVIDRASEYLFSINHSQPYSFEGYASAYLRYYYPTEFLTCALNINRDKEEKTIAITTYAKKVGVRIESIRFRYSGSDYTCDAANKTIYKGLGSIKFMSSKVANELYELRDNDYPAFVDLLADINEKTSCDSRQLDMLIKLDFFSEFGNPNLLLKEYEIFDILFNRKTFKLSVFTDDYPIPLYAVEKYAEKKTEKTISNFDWYKVCRLVCSGLNIKTSHVQKLRYEQEILGYISSVFPNMADDYYMVSGFQGKTEQIMLLYQLKTGQTISMRYRKKFREQNPTEVGAVIRVTEIKEEGRWTKSDTGEWIRDWSNLEPNLIKWQVLSA